MINKTISHYKILEKIGEGGMGVVYKAEDTKLKRIVALKFLPPELTRDKESKKRFLHEAQAASAMDHPNICTVHEIGETEDGQMFIAMGYYEGKTLKEKIANSPLPIANAINIAIQIAEGLNKAHVKEIVHRDIKSANIIITAEGTAKILDFGLAKLRGRTKLTKEGSTLGTIDYMSPEQASGEESDHRSDIWSLGVLLYEMVTGQVPFKGEYEQAIMYSIMNEEPEPVTGLRTGIPMELERIINKTLNKDISTRYQNITDMIVDLKNLIKKSEKTTKDPQKGIVKKKRVLSKKTFKWWGLILPVVLVMAGYLLLKEKPQTEKPSTQKTSEIEKLSENQWKNSIAVLPFSNISADKEQEYFCDGITEEIITKLTTIKDLKVISRTSVMKFKKSEKTIKEIGLKLGVENVLEGSVRKDKNRIRITAQLIRVADDAHLWAKNYDRNLESIFEVQDEVSRAIANSLEVTLSPEVLDQFKSGETKNMLAYEYYLKGMYIFNSRYYLDMNDKTFYAVVAMFKKALEIDPNYARAYGGLSWAYGNHYIVNRDIKYFNLALKFARKTRELAPDSPEGYGGGIGHSYSMMGKYDLAYFEFKKALQKAPNNAILNFTIGFYYHKMGLYHQALQYCTRAIELDPLLLLPYITKARSSVYLRNYGQSVQYLNKALDFFPDQKYLIRLYCTHYLWMKNYDKAEKYIDMLEKGEVSFRTTKEQKAILFAARGEKKKALVLGVESCQVYSLLGKKDNAIKLMQKELKKKEDDYTYLYLINTPHYANLREDPRFQKIVADAKKIYEERLKKYGDL